MFAYDSAYPVVLLVKILTCSTSGWVVVERPVRNIAVLQLCFNTHSSIIPGGDGQAQRFGFVGLNSCLHDRGLTGQWEAHPRKRQQEQLQHRNRSDKISYLSFNEQIFFLGSKYGTIPDSKGWLATLCHLIQYWVPFLSCSTPPTLLELVLWNLRGTSTHSPQDFCLNTVLKCSHDCAKNT